jgi:hypothetical protein
MEQDDPLRREGAAHAPAAPANATGGIDWAAVERDFIHSGLSQDRIAQRHGTTRGRIARHAQRGGWVRLVPVAPLPFGPKPRPPGAPKLSRTERRMRRILERLYRVLDRKMKSLEARMIQAQADDANPQSAADGERDVRTLGAVASVYAKVIELEEQMRKSQAGMGSNTDASGRSEDADHLRRDLALRLRRLNQAADD